MTTPPLASCVVDTNVALVAVGQAPQASGRCAKLCLAKLRELMEHGRIVLDHRDLILSEYRHKLSFAGQPGILESFVKWAHDHEWNEDRCHRVRITPRGPHGDCEEFPPAAALEKFDLSDRKFVAAASVSKAPVLNAIDSDWKHHEAALAEAGIQVIFLCPDELKPGPGEPSREPRTSQVSPHSPPFLVGPDARKGRQGAPAPGGGGVPRRRTRRGGKG